MRDRLLAHITVAEALGCTADVVTSHIRGVGATLMNRCVWYYNVICSWRLLHNGLFHVDPTGVCVCECECADGVCKRCWNVAKISNKKKHKEPSNLSKSNVARIPMPIANICLCKLLTEKYKPFSNAVKRNPPSPSNKNTMLANPFTYNRHC